jgi:hypothetical protein
MFRHNGKQLKRRIGPAWLERDETGGWRPRRGRVPDGFYDERRAHVAGAQIVSDYLAEAANVERIEHERRTRGITFREVAQGYLGWLRDVKGAKPSTLADYRYLLAEPGMPFKRGKGESAGHCNVLGRTLDGSAVRRRFKRARGAAGLRPLRFHDLRHTYGSLLAAAGIDLVSI